MNTQMEDKRNILDLEFIEGLLNDQRIRTHLTEKSEQFALSFLTVELTDSPFAGAVYMQLMYIPSAEAFDETNLLQFFCYLPEELTAGSTDFTELLRFLNSRTPFGYFAFGEDGKLFYRYVYALPRFDVPRKALFLEVFDLFTKTFNAFGSVLQEFVQGDISLEEAKSKL